MKGINGMKRLGIVLLIIGVIVGSVGVVSAATLSVDTTKSTDATSNQYASISEAVTDAADGDTIELANDNYTLDSTVEVTTNNLTIASADNSEVTLNATNTTSGNAFNASAVDSFTVSNDVVVNSGGAFFGSLAGDSEDMMVYGVLAVILVGGYVYVKDN